MAKEGRFVDSLAQPGRVTLSSLMFILKQGTVFFRSRWTKAREYTCVNLPVSTLSALRGLSQPLSSSLSDTRACVSFPRKLSFFGFSVLRSPVWDLLF